MTYTRNYFLILAIITKNNFLAYNSLSDPFASWNPRSSKQVEVDPVQEIVCYLVFVTPTLQVTAQTYVRETLWLL